MVVLVVYVQRGLMEPSVTRALARAIQIHAKMVAAAPQHLVDTVAAVY